MRLKAAIGEAAFWVPPRLWAYAAENQPDGNFSDYTPEEIASVIGYNGDATSMLQALLRAGFMDDGQKIHDWTEHAHFHVVHKERAKAAAKARWDKVKEKKKREEEKRGEDRGRASSNAPSMLEAGSSPRFASHGGEKTKHQKFISELNTQILRASEEIQRLKDLGRPEDRPKIAELAKKKRQWREELFNQ